MIKKIAIVALLSLSIPFNSYADDDDRITKLEKDVQELKLRILQMESLFSKHAVVQDIVTSNEGYKSIANWRQLTTDMGYNDVKKLLGEPQRVDGGNIAQWYYQNGGQVIFQMNKAWQWKEPRK